MPSFYEFFAGGGMVRAGLGTKWQCLFANDFDHKKSRTYKKNWGDGQLKTVDVGSLTTGDIPGHADLAWASFPCQDLSLAGGGAGLKGDRSGTFWPFWNLMKGLIDDNRAPRLIVLENVGGMLTSHNGSDFRTICTALQTGGYSVGAMMLDASFFVPQSRPRLFIICSRNGAQIPERLRTELPQPPWHTRIKRAYNELPGSVASDWIWWHLPMPGMRTTSFADLIEENPPDVEWFSRDQMADLLAQMSTIHREKLRRVKQLNRPIVGGLYRRTRENDKGIKVQRAEVRFDEVSGCLRTPAGGSSRQVIVVVDGATVRARLISSRETARLMGLPDTYELPGRYNEAYHLTGDGVVVPVVRHLAKYLLEPLVESHDKRASAAA